MNHTNILQEMIRAIEKAQQETVVYETLFHDDKGLHGENEYLFFVKPEITQPSVPVKLEAILGMVFKQLDTFDLSLTDIRIIGAKYLRDHSVIARHYGVINAVSLSASKNLTEGAREQFKKITGLSPDEANLLGSLEVLQRYPDITPLSLDNLWQHAKTEKLAGGTYMARILLDGQETYVINGFHPMQLEHYTRPGRSIVTMVLTGNRTWEEARRAFIGATNPVDAMPGSLRHQLMQRRKEFGIQAVSSSWNGFHLSAGPVEGLVELIRFTSDFSSGRICQPADFSFGKLLTSHFNTGHIQRIMENTLLDAGGKRTTVFDLTEEKNSKEALELLKKYLN